MRKLSLFKKLSQPPESEEKILELWKNRKILDQSLKLKRKSASYAFYEGPPTANGEPGIHHLLSRAYKDLYIRFNFLCGYRVLRKAGWDCHGLPVEREVEKKLNISSKDQIVSEVGIENFNAKCRASVLQYIKSWNRFSDRMGFSLNLKNAYFTLDNDYMLSVWRILGELWKKNLIYQDYQVVPCDPVLGSTMSDAELELGYRETEDPSVYLKFYLKKNPLSKKLFAKFPKIDTKQPIAFLVWTTTPWTLTANIALAVNATSSYCIVYMKTEKEYLICANKCWSQLESKERRDYELVSDATFLGSELIGLEYKPLFHYSDKFETIGKQQSQSLQKKAFHVVAGDFVTMDSGSGIVHIAPAYGMNDLLLARQIGLPLLHTVGLDGKFLPFTKYANCFFKDADKQILNDLEKKKNIFRSERMQHSYPFGYRTGAPLIYYAKHVWYIRTTSVKDHMLKNNTMINWLPSHIQNGRFGNWLMANRNWAISRERYWGTPLPIWADKRGNFRCVPTLEELAKLSGKKLSELQKMDLHRPFIDTICFKDPNTKTWMHRVPEVLDCWFDSGAMPFAQWGLGSKIFKGSILAKKTKLAETIQNNYPADFICEAVDQTRGWFYTLLAISTLLGLSTSYRNVICLGHVLDERGQKMSKSKGNIVDPWQIFSQYGADAIRWHFLTSVAEGNSRRLGKIGDHNHPLNISQSFLNTIRNSVNFFILYAQADSLIVCCREPLKFTTTLTKKKYEAQPVDQRTDLDRWLLAYVEQTSANVYQELKNYRSHQAGVYLSNFVDHLSNWYIRRNRRRFWQSGLNTDKINGYASLYQSLLRLAQMLASFVPFVAEEIYQSLVISQQDNIEKSSSTQPKIYDSIHLTLWKTPDDEMLKHQAKLLAEGDVLLHYASLGRAARKNGRVKVRQSLSRMWIYVENEHDRKILEKQTQILREELNVRKIIILSERRDDLEIQIKPNLPILGKKLGVRRAAIPHIQRHLREANSQELKKQIEQQGYLNLQISVPPQPPDQKAKKYIQNNWNIRLASEDLLISYIAPHDRSILQDENGNYVSLDLKLTKDLLIEGYCRDIIRHVQILRKDANLSISDRIYLKFDFVEISKPSKKYLQQVYDETLATPIVATKNTENKKTYTKEIAVGPGQVTITLRAQDQRS